MKQDAIILNLPKDLGDALLAVSAIQKLQAFADAAGVPLVATGGARSREWVETLSGLALDFRTGDDLAQLQPRFAVNFNFYDSDSLGKTFPDAPVYAPEKLRVLETDEAEFGAGAVIGKKHIALLLEDALKQAGVMGLNEKLPVPQLPSAFLADAFVAETRAKYGISGKYAILIPVAAANRPLKKWPKENYANVARQMLAQGVTPVIMGGPSPDEKALTAEIKSLAGAGVIDIGGLTTLPEIGALAKGAVLTLGNDTGPMHIAAAAGGPSFAFFGYYSDPATWRPVTPGNTALVLGGKKVPDITVAETLDALAPILTPSKPANLTPKIRR